MFRPLYYRPIGICPGCTRFNRFGPTWFGPLWGGPCLGGRCGGWPVSEAYYIPYESLPAMEHMVPGPAIPRMMPQEMPGKNNPNMSAQGFYDIDYV